MKVVVLGRDGVINQQGSDGAVTADNFVAVRGSLRAIAKLNQAGFRVVVATNQQQLSRDELSVEQMHDVHLKLLQLVAESGGRVDGIFFAPSGNPRLRCCSRSVSVIEYPRTSSPWSGIRGKI